MVNAQRKLQQYGESLEEIDLHELRMTQLIQC